MSTVYATDHLSAAERFDFWSDVICDAYLPIECKTPETETFEGRIELDRLSKLAISRVTGSPQRVTRHKGQIARDADAYFMLSLQMSDTGHLSQGGRSAALQPGDFGLYSTTDPYEILCNKPVHQLIIQMPCEALLARVPQAHMLTGLGVAATTELGGLVSSQLRQTAASVVGQSALVQSHLQDMILDLIAAGLSTLVEDRVELSRPEQLLLVRAKCVIRDHLRDDHLSPALVAEAVGMSKRNLARVFERGGETIAGYIRQSRMQAIAADLVDPLLGAHSISQLACKYGITNFQHFSKVFKDTFDMTPRAYRAAKRTLQ